MNTPNIIDNIKAVNAPSGAQFCILTADCKSIALFYRINPDNKLEYFSSCGSGWMGTNERDLKKFLTETNFYSV